MGHKKMFNGPEGNQRRSDKQNFGFLANGAANRQAATNGNSSTAISVCNTLLLMLLMFMFHVKHKSSSLSIFIFIHSLTLVLICIQFLAFLLQNTWYRDVMELRKKAGEYKVGIPYNKDAHPLI